jgi:hypothetical protein
MDQEARGGDAGVEATGQQRDAGAVGAAHGTVTVTALERE